MEPDVLHLLDYEESDIMMVRKFNIELDLKYFDKEEIDPDPELGIDTSEINTIIMSPLGNVNHSITFADISYVLFHI